MIFVEVNRDKPTLRKWGDLLSICEWLNHLQSFFVAYPSCVYYPTMCQEKDIQNKYGQNHIP